MTDRMALVGDPEIGLELRRGESRLPPAWADNLEESHYAMSRLKNKLNDLKSLYDKHLLRPTLDDSTDEEQQIEVLTQEITRVCILVLFILKFCCYKYLFVNKLIYMLCLFMCYFIFEVSYCNDYFKYAEI